MSLLEGVPGTAKTLIAKTLAMIVSGEFSRVQFTPDLMPSDIVGTSVYDLTTNQFNIKARACFHECTASLTRSTARLRRHNPHS